MRIPAWQPTQGELWMVAPQPRKLFDIHDIALSLASLNSNADVTGELVDVGLARPQDFEGKDVKGKFVLAGAAVGTAYAQGVQRGAVGALGISVIGPQRASDYPNQIVSTNVNATQPNSVAWAVTPEVQRSLAAMLARGQTITLRSITKSVQVIAELSDPPGNVQVGQVTITPEAVDVTGPSTLVDLVVSARVTATIDASSVDVDRDVQPDAIDANGEIVNGVDIAPPIVHLDVEVFENLSSRTVPVNPVAVFPNGSRAVTVTGIATPATVVAGWPVNTSWLAAAGAIANPALVAPVSAPEAAVSVYPAPTRSIESPGNVATPATAGSAAAPARVPPPGLLPIATVTVPVNPAAVLPNWSRAVTTTAIIRCAIWMAMRDDTPLSCIVTPMMTSA